MNIINAKAERMSLERPCKIYTFKEIDSNTLRAIRKL